MSKTLNQITIKDIIESALEECHEDFQGGYEHDTESESYPYGDTYACGRPEVTEESVQRATEEWKDTFDVYEFITEYLAENYDFCEKIKEMVRGF